MIKTCCRNTITARICQKMEIHHFKDFAFPDFLNTSIHNVTSSKEIADE